MLYGQAISQSDCKKAGPYQLPSNKTGYGVDDTLKGKNLLLDVAPGQTEFANLSGFQSS